MNKNRKKACLVLAGGEVFEGWRIGAETDSVGELVFTTGMGGYISTMTDPSYAGQIVMQTFPLIGNYGIIESDFEGQCRLRGYVVRECCDSPSNFRSQYTVDEFLKKQGVPGIAGVDTRYLTRLIREKGVVNASICSRPPEDLSHIREYRIRGVVAEASCKKIEFCPPETLSFDDGSASPVPTKYSVGLIDYGAKQGILRELRKRGCAVTVYPSSTPAETILSGRHDGIMLSNGPGDPAENVDCVKQLQKLIGRIPVFGICLGHQLAALAMGGKTVKMKYGHRGVNQPVQEVGGVRTYITSQNHGYAVVGESLKGVGQVRFVNANDGSCEGVVYPGKNCFTVQFHPEACSGALDTVFLFDRFLSMMDGRNVGLD